MCIVFLWLCGLFLIATATVILLQVPEHLIAPTDAQPVDNGNGGDVRPGGGGSALISIEGVEEIGDMYGKLTDILCLPALHVLFLYLVTMQVGLSMETRNSE